jgi:hypothetical protein
MQLPCRLKRDVVIFQIDAAWVPSLEDSVAQFKLLDAGHMGMGRNPFVLYYRRHPVGRYADDVSSLHRSACAVDRRHRDTELRLEDAGTIALSSTPAAIIGRDTPGGFPAWRRAPWAVLR